MAEEIPRHNVIDSQYGLETSSLIVMCRATRFCIDVSIDDLEGTSYEAEFLRLAETLEADDDDHFDDEEALCSWMLQPCYSKFRELVPETVGDLTLERFYYPSTHHLPLVASRQSLEARISHRQSSPGCSLPVTQSSQLPWHRAVRRYQASALHIVPTGRPNYDYMCDVPEQVRTKDGNIKFFKPAFDVSQFIREVDTYIRIDRAGLAGSLRIPGLTGIVVSQDRKMTLGILFDLIPSFGENLQSPECVRAREHHAKWKSQVVSVVDALHAHNIVWGDVHPGNIVIDKGMNANIVDFGGGWIEAFVDRRKAGTKEGDWQGVQRIFDDWIKDAS